MENHTQEESEVIFVASILSGHYSHNIDEKNRLFIPVKHRDQLGETFMMTHIVDKCLSLYSMEEWEKLTDKANALPQVQARDVLRVLFASAVDVQPDKQGRIVIPQELREYAEIEKTSVVIGAGNHAEIWSEANWAKKKLELESPAMLDTLIELGF